MRLSTPLGVIFGLLVIGDSAPALGFEYLKTQSGQPLAWPGQRVDFFIEQSIDSSNAAQVRAAYDTWATVTIPSFRIHYGGLQSEGSDTSNSTTYIEREWDAAYGDEELTVAHTRLVYDVSTGTISQADILLNGSRFDFGDGAGRFDTQSVVLHEVGHALGIAHSCGEPGGRYPSCFDVSDSKILDAVMAPTLSLGLVKRELGHDELDALEDRYGLINRAQGPRIREVLSSCFDDNLTLLLDDIPEQIQVEARDYQGKIWPLQVLSAREQEFDIGGTLPIEVEGIDLVVRDISSGAYGVYYGFESRSSSDCQPDAGTLDSGIGRKELESATGCSCKTQTRSTELDMVFWFLALLPFVFVARLRARGLAGVTCLVLCLGASNAQAYRCTRVDLTVGPSLIWTEREIGWFLSEELTDDFSSPDEVITMVSESFDAWTEPSCSDLSFAYRGQKAGLKAEFNPQGTNENVVVFVKSGWLHQPGVVALTSNAFDRGSGVILDTDIEINDQFFGWVSSESMCTTEMDLKNALVHEIGHFIGLAHPPNTDEFIDTTMFAVAEPCENKKRTLSQDDIDGLCAIYPAGQAVQQCHPPEGPGFIQTEKDLGYGCSNLAHNSGSWWLYLLGLMLYCRKIYKNEQK